MSDFTKLGSLHYIAAQAVSYRILYIYKQNLERGKVKYRVHDSEGGLGWEIPNTL